MSVTTRSFMKAVSAAYGATLVLMAAPAHGAIDVANSPLFLTVTVPPNLTVTLDDSGSMARAYVPEICDGDSDNECSLLNDRYAKSSHFNLLHYNPSVTYPAPKDANGNDLSTSFTAALVNGFDTNQGTVNLSTGYRPTSFLDLPVGGPAAHGLMRHYDPDFPGATNLGQCDNNARPRVCEFRSNTAASWINSSIACSGTDNTQRNNYCAGRTPQPAYYYVYDPANSGCWGSTAQRAEDNDCYDRVVVSATSGPGGTDERQNFANWYSFARTRNLATQTAASLAFSDVDPDVRVAWQALNTCRADSSNLVTTDCEGWKENTDFSNAIQPFTGQHKTNFYNWLFQLPTNNSTPLPTSMRRVGTYYSQTTGETSPYNNETGNDASEQLSCRRNYHVMMTDGIWNTAVDVNGNRDNQTIGLPDGTTYTPRDPYSDAWSNTLADVAFRYWAQDLAAGLDNNVSPSIPDLSGNDEEQQYWNPRNDPATWQHMVNFTIGLGLSGFLEEAGLTWDGDMYSGSYTAILNNTTQWPWAYSNSTNAANVADLWHAAINSRGQFFSADDPGSLSVAFRAALTAINGSSGSSAALSANSTSLTGSTRVYQAKFFQDWSGALLALPVGATAQVSSAPLWDASELVPAHGSRNIFTYNIDTNSGANFTSCSNLGTGQQAALNRNSGGVVDGLCTERLGWLRGDRTHEVSSTAATSINRFRNRPLLPNGRPKVMGDIINSDPAYVKNVDFGYSGLSDGGGGDYAGYVASNASRMAMVYVGANDGRVYGINADTGIEQFSYIPGGVYDNLSHLTDPSYTHRYYVDGSIIVRDAYIGGSWKTVLVAGLNAGGRSVYALDVTNPSTFSSSNVLWEFDAEDDPDDLGLTYSRPQIGVLESGQWVAVFGNGYNSRDGGAHLFVVDLETGALLNKITAADGSGDDANGLSTPLLIDADQDRKIDFAYAGDLQGNLWKFDLSGAGAASWTVANGRPMFRSVGQPITAQPKGGSHPNGGLLIYFGTGRYIANDDVFDASPQTFYGIWDDHSWTATAERGDLQEQTIDVQTDARGRTVRSISTHTVNWSGGARGWYLDLLENGASQQGERVVNTSLVVKDLVVFSSIIPSTDPCTPGGTSWLYALSRTNGGEVNREIFDLDNDGEFDSSVDEHFVNAVKTQRLGITNVPVLIVESDTEVSDPTPDDPTDDPFQDVEIGFAFNTGTSGEFESNKLCLKLGGCEEGSVVRRSWIQIR